MHWQRAYCARAYLLPPCFARPELARPVPSPRNRHKCAQLPDDLRIAFDTYALDVIVLSEADEEEVREMFLRLQNGTSLCTSTAFLGRRSSYTLI